MAVFLVFWILQAVNFIELFKNLAEQGLSSFLEAFVMLFTQLQGLPSHRLMIRSLRFFKTSMLVPLGRRPKDRSLVI
jgi:hypothetical protein